MTGLKVPGGRREEEEELRGDRQHWQRSKQ